MYTLTYQELDYVEHDDISGHIYTIWQPKISESYHTVKQLELLLKSLEDKTIKIWRVGV